MALGFSSGAGKGSKRQLNSLEDVESLLKSEIVSCDWFRNQLIKEVKELDDLKANFNLIISQVEHIKRLAKERDAVLNKLLKEYDRIKSEINIDLINRLYQMMYKIDEELRPMLNHISKEVSKLVIEETHILYQQSKENKREMDRINDKARDINIEIIRISKMVYAFDDDLRDIMTKVHEIKEERESRMSKDSKIGF